MSILQVSADAPLVLRAGAATLLFLHITGACMGLISGAASMVFRKGGRLHRIAGNVFFVSMLTMSAVGACVAPFMGAPLDSLMAVFVFYLVATAWMTVRRKPGTIGHFETVAFVTALCAIATALAFAFIASTEPSRKFGGYPAGGFLAIATVVSMFAIADLRMILRGGATGAKRLARHLSRMGLALFIALMSALAQPQMVPANFAGSSLQWLPVGALVISLLYWSVRVRWRKRAQPHAPAAQSPAPASSAIMEYTS